MRRVAGRELAEEQAAFADLALQRRVPAGIAHVQSGAQHGDRGAPRLERAPMRRGVDTPCETADHARAAALIVKTPNASSASIGGGSSSPSRSILVKTTQCGFSPSSAE